MASERGIVLKPFSGPSGPAGGVPSGGDPNAPLDRKLCQVVGTNQNFTSATGTLYHVQVEDRGPVLDRITETEVRRVNVIVYANYGEPNARIIHGRDHDFPDVRTSVHNAFVSGRIQELAQEARGIVEDKERRQIDRIKALIREYYLTKDETHKKEFEEANATFPFLFSRAWMELKADKAKPATAPAPPPPPEAEAPPEEVLYPLDAELRDRVIEIERMLIDLGNDLQQLKAMGGLDDILLQTSRKMVARAKDSISGRDASEFNVRRLEMTRNSLATTWRQIKSRLRK